MKIVHKTQVDYTWYDILTDNQLNDEIKYFFIHFAFAIVLVLDALGFIPRPEVSDKYAPVAIISLVICFVVIAGMALEEGEHANSN